MPKQVRTCCHALGIEEKSTSERGNEELNNCSKV